MKKKLNGWRAGQRCKVCTNLAPRGCDLCYSCAAESSHLNRHQPYPPCVHGPVRVLMRGGQPVDQPEQLAAAPPDDRTFAFDLESAAPSELQGRPAARGVHA